MSRKASEIMGFATQKARGLGFLHYFFRHEHWPLRRVNGCQEYENMRVWPSEVMAQGLPPLEAFFARPCPTIPRHGFVDSRRVVTANDTARVIAETLAADPRGEIIFSKPLTGKWSGIITNAGVTFGASNDGATAGKGSIDVPCPTDPAIIMGVFGIGKKPLISDYSGMGFEKVVQQSPFIEFVHNVSREAGEKRPYDYAEFVQLRDGPPLPASSNYIPHKVTVSAILPIWEGEEPDLLEWETKVNALPLDAVIYLPGQSLASHYAVHGVARGIAVITGKAKCPLVGETLEPSANDLTLRPADYKRLAAFIRQAWDMPVSSRAQHDIALAVAALHAQGSWGRDIHLLALRALGAVMACRYVTAAALGEDRHFYSSAGPGGSDIDRLERPWEPESCGDPRCRACRFEVHRYNRKLARYHAKVERLNAKKPDATERCAAKRLGFWACKDPHDRSTVYKFTLRLGSTEVYKALRAAYEDFCNFSWPGGYGGRKWANVADGGIKLWEALEAFSRAPNADHWTKVVQAWNVAINTVHNNGNVFTKWLDTRAMDVMAAAPAFGLANPVVWNAINQPVKYFAAQSRAGKEEQAAVHEAVRNARAELEGAS